MIELVEALVSPVQMFCTGGSFVPIVIFTSYRAGMYVPKNNYVMPNLEQNEHHILKTYLFE